MKISPIKLVAATAVAAALTQSAQAVPVQGNIGFSGAAQLDSGSVQTATEVVAWFNNVVDSSSGSFLTVPVNSAVTLASPWFFSSGTLNNFWTVGGFTFDLTSSTISLQNGLFLDVVLAGTVHGNGYDSTAFTGTFQVANPPANGLATFTERLSFANSVPDGGTTELMLGSALCGLGLIKFANRQKVA